MTFSTGVSAAIAVAATNGTYHLGRKIVVEFAKPENRRCKHFYIVMPMYCAVSRIMQSCFVQSTASVRCRLVQYFCFAFTSHSLIMQLCCREYGTIERDSYIE